VDETDALLVQFVGLALEEVGEEAHEAADLVGRAFPVLSGEGVQSEIFDAVAGEA
jgi:hypothetical protein